VPSAASHPSSNTENKDITFTEYAPEVLAQLPPQVSAQFPFVISRKAAMDAATASLYVGLAVEGGHTRRSPGF
jgi:hypothetical protein